MNEQEKQAYLEHYKELKKKGELFFPYDIFKDAVVSLLVLVVLVALAYFVGTPTEARANPADTSYLPRPEWYFLFLFQMLKYFPGNLEVIGVVVVPGIVFGLMIALPFFDRSPKRFFLNRPIATASAVIILGGIVLLTVLSLREAPPPQAVKVVDQAAALYTKHCSNCHGPHIDVPPGTNLHQLIAQGNHAGMPAWGSDLSSDEIDALAGFITSPQGSQLFTTQCGACHDLTVMAAGNPIELERALDEGPSYPAHQGKGVPDWKTTLTSAERNALLNFLAAPDGERLFAINCAGCHGQGVAYTGDATTLKDLISKGAHTQTMPAWSGTLSSADLDTLAAYVTDPAGAPAGKDLFAKNCATCHGQTIPKAASKAAALDAIAKGGGHQTMPVWGKLLTPEQLDALVAYTLAASQGNGAVAGEKLFAANCSSCHGRFGEGGPNPANPNSQISPISSADFLKPRDDATLHDIISMGQSDLGMPPFGSASGGQLSEDDINAIVAFMRQWQGKPPIQGAPTPAPVRPAGSTLTGAQLFVGVCARCHGASGEGDLGPALNTPEAQARYTDQALSDLITQGRKGTTMIGWGTMLTPDQVQQLVKYVRGLPQTAPVATATSVSATPASAPSFSIQVAPLLNDNCAACHNASTKLGGWDASTYKTVLAGGVDGPAVVPGDAKNSLLAQKMLGTQTVGGIMPPGGMLSKDKLQIITDWIAAGAPNN
jgi:mono/diheme cytochrome c family protein